MKTRIIRRIFPEGSYIYVVQQRKLFAGWIDARPTFRALTTSPYFNTLLEAKSSLPIFDGTPTIDQTVD